MPEKYVCIYLQISFYIHAHQSVLIICHCAGCFLATLNELFVFLFFPGIRSWDTNLMDCNIDQELKLFVSRHSARFSADAKGKTEQITFIKGIPEHKFCRTAFSDIQHWHHCALESIFQVAALCKGLRFVCNAAVSLLYHPFHRL